MEYVSIYYKVSYRMKSTGADSNKKKQLTLSIFNVYRCKIKLFCSNETLYTSIL